jgi:hypothetical protein
MKGSYTHLRALEHLDSLNDVRSLQEWVKVFAVILAFILSVIITKEEENV